MENLVFLLERIMQTGNDNILSEEIILVQSTGIQHWLNLKLAVSRGISMNLSFSLPMLFFWNQIRAVLGKENVPEKSSYTREVMSWRLYDLLASDMVVNNPVCQEASQYWLAKDNFNIHHSGQLNSEKVNMGDDEKRFQLACQIADLFEQYLIFRPDWLLDWEQGHSNSQAENSGAKQWQAFLWQQLVAQDQQHPIYLLKQTMLSLKENPCHLPERISLFGINTLPPLWLNFLSELGDQTQIHFFHLNPCVEYWGDLKTDKAQAKEQFYRWLESSDAPLLDDETSNPLLSNLGTQGKDFLFLLQEHTSIEIPVFESPENSSIENGEQATVLQKVQSDILNLQDVRGLSQIQIDDSISFASAHSALREIQALHDWLLHQINNDDSLTPKDILVMCPNVEDYAPYVDAVFAHGWNDWSEQVPPLPCSIADRTLKDSEPLVQAFIDLLDLPDSRFQVSQILSYLRLPAVQQKFSFSEEDLVLLERWVNHASIHWGLDANHKQNVLMSDSASETSNNKFTWQQGLDRLLLGFAYSDQNTLYQEQLLLPDVEGDEALLLGRYFYLLEQLQYCARELLVPRTPNEWKQFLLQTKDSLFSVLPVDVNAQQIIEQAIDDLGEYTCQAHYDKKIPLTIIRDFLSNHFNQPEPGRQFMAGQVTFCSMVPMRSVPFRIIAVLGLNDGEFPRQRQPMGFDLMAMEPPRKGDRSRRGDDRYLFLEAIISCREKLYLSYQGHDIKTNNTREPSLVLQELMDYLEKGYGWQLQDSSGSATQLFKVPMQAFSQENYQNDPLKDSGAKSAFKQKNWKSFNANWLKLNAPGKHRNNLHEISHIDSDECILSAETLVQFFDNPSKSFAQNRLGLYFEQSDSMIPDDSEPFVSNHLDRYLIQDAIIKTALCDDANEQKMSDLISGFHLGGTLPDTPNSKDDLLVWQEQAVDFANYVQSEIQPFKKEQGVAEVLLKSVTVEIDDVSLQAELPLLGNRLIYWRLATPKGKDDIRLWIHHLIAQLVFENITTLGIFRGDKKSSKKASQVKVQMSEGEQAISTIYFEPDSAAWAREQLSALIQCWQEGMKKPLLLNASLGQKHLISKPLDEYGFTAFWNDNFQTQGLGSDPYMHWFWGEHPEALVWEDNWQLHIEKIYSPLYDKRKDNS